MHPLVALEADLIECLLRRGLGLRGLLRLGAVCRQLWLDVGQSTRLWLAAAELRPIPLRAAGRMLVLPPARVAALAHMSLRADKCSARQLALALRRSDGIVGVAERRAERQHNRQMERRARALRAYGLHLDRLGRTLWGT